MDWLATINNPIALFATIAFLFIGGIVTIWKLSAVQNARLVDKFLDRADSQNQKLVQVVEKNTEASTRQSISLDHHTEAIHRLASVVDGKLGIVNGD